VTAPFHPREKSYWLHRLCEANFARLSRLVPDFHAVDTLIRAESPGNPPLHLRLVERAPFTLLLELTHHFSQGVSAILEPQVLLRVSLDARTVEMLSDHQRPDVNQALEGVGHPLAVLDYKWTMNYFLSRWLDHCLTLNYQSSETKGAAQAPSVMTSSSTDSP